MSEIHPLVLATIEHERARRELELERLRSAREACVTSSAGGQSRALALGKKIRQVERITASWRLVLATVLGEVEDAQETAERETEAFRLVAYRSKINGLLFCRVHGEGTRFTEGLSSEDLPYGGVCSQCRGDVLAFDGMVRAAKRETEALRVVGSRSPRLGKLRCVACTAEHRERFDTGRLVDVTSEDLPDGGVCSQCHGDVLA